jgi:hypothetical protein
LIILKGIKTKKETLQGTIDRKLHELKKIYPEMIETARGKGIRRRKDFSLRQ